MKKKWRNWRYGQWFPECDRFPTRAEAQTEIVRIQKKFLLKGMLVVGCITGPTTAMTILVAGTLFGGLLPTWIVALCGGIGGATGALGMRWWNHRLIAIGLRRSLLKRGIPICIPCGYDLRGPTEPRCPECGTPFDVALLDKTADSGETHAKQVTDNAGDT